MLCCLLVVARCLWFVVGFWLQLLFVVVCCSLLFGGCWLSVVGCWLLVVRCSLRVACCMLLVVCLLLFVGGCSLLFVAC